MNCTTIKKSWSVLRRLHSGSVQLKRTDTSNITVNTKHTISESGKTLLLNNEPKAQQFKKHQFQKKTNQINKTSESVLSNFIFSNKNDPDSFGSLSNDWKMHQQLKKMPDEEDDTVETEFLFNKEGKTRLSINQYGKIIKQFLNEKKVALALEVLETRMLKNDKAKPDSYIYKLLISGCGDVGYTKKAFNLYNQMKKRGLTVPIATYTSLFNACANSPYPEDALKRARHLQGLMLEKGVLMNDKIYHAMIKAFGRCGDLETAFMLVDEMIEKKIRVSADTFCFLLQACITDKTSGFRHALLVWRKMQEKRLRPTLFSFNLLLRCSRECGLGDEVATQQVIQLILNSGQKKAETLSITEGSGNPETQLSLVPSTRADNLPNLIGRSPTMGDVTAVNSISRPEHRLMLIGGSRAVLEQMKLCQVKPDIKTFTQLLDQIPSCLEDEQELLDAAREARVQLDVDFCNMLIRKRCLRKDYDNAKNVLKIIGQESLRPNIMTFGVLAMACQSLPSAKQILQDINKIGYRPNIEILGTLLKNACYARDCHFVMEILGVLEKEDIKPNEMFSKHLENFYNFITSELSNKLKGGSQKKDIIEEFCEYYQFWRQRVQPEAPPHPWEQFRVAHSDPEDIELMNTGRVKYVK